ncbi:hypothetical protein [Burkholderia sp. PU8-34]
MADAAMRGFFHWATVFSDGVSGAATAADRTAADELAEVIDRENQAGSEEKAV